MKVRWRSGWHVPVATVNNMLETVDTLVKCSDGIVKRVNYRTYIRNLRGISQIIVVATDCHGGKVWLIKDILRACRIRLFPVGRQLGKRPT